jgi:tripartite-type tricarboxylate transporter receptor subunit TctC
VLEKILKATIVVDNRPGASAQIAAEAVARAPADGYTILSGDIATHAINPCVFAKLRYDPLKDFAPISLRGRSPMVLLANASTSIKSVRDLVAQARNSAEPLPYASPSLGSPQHLQMELLARKTGAFLRPVMFKGEAPAIIDVVGGQLPIMFAFPVSALPHVQAGKLRALAVTSSQRIASYPDTPTFNELGMPQLESYSWGAFYAPAGTPKPILDKLAAAIARANQTPEIIEYVAAFGSEAIHSTPEELAAWTRKEIERICPIAKEAGIRIE